MAAAESRRIAAALSKSVIAVWLAAGQIFERMGISNAEIEVMITRAKEKE